jgi:KaiC/GvpD/RAD55 family RecA-like ATPase
MDGSSDSLIDQAALQGDAFPDGLTPGLTVLIAGVDDPSRYAVGLQALCQYGHADDAAIVVTTTESAEQTIETSEMICPDSDRPSLGLVDTTSEQPSVAALYQEPPIVFIPSSGDLERLVLSLSDLTDDRSPMNGTRHLVIRSLTPVLKNASTARVCTVLERISGLRAGTGLCLLGLEYTAHDEETMAALAEQVDGILWVTQASENHLGFEFRPTRDRHNRSVTGSDDDD